MHLIRQIPQNYLLERRFCLPSRADFLCEHAGREALVILVRTFHVIDSRRDDKNTHRDTSRTDSVHPCQCRSLSPLCLMKVERQRQIRTITLIFGLGGGQRNMRTNFMFLISSFLLFRNVVCNILGCSPAYGV
jgi:hypothetical protein